MTILAIDDDARFIKSCSRILTDAGFAVETASDGPGALGVLRSNPEVEVVLADVRLPGIDGLTLAHAIREIRPDVPVIIMTGYPDVPSAARAIELNIYRYLVKPIDRQELQEVVRRARHTYRLSRLKRDARVLVESETDVSPEDRDLESRFLRLLGSIQMVYQPVVDARTEATVAYEAFVRHSGPTLKTPGELINAAQQLSRMEDLGRRIRAEITDTIRRDASDRFYFVNVHSEELLDFEIYHAESPLSTVASRVVLDITERGSLGSIEGLSAKVTKLRNLGFRIAIDDVGAGYAGLSSLGLLEPEVVKLDMSLIRDIHRSDPKQSVVRAMVRLCREELGVLVACEGVEAVEEREVLKDFGCDYLQGYLFGAPAPLPSIHN